MRYIKLFFIILALILIPVTPVSAINDKDKHAVIYDTMFYDATDIGCTASNTSTPLTGSDNVQKAFNYFVAKGLTDYQASGIIGNFMQESGQGLDPTIIQGGSSGTAPINGKGFGIAQWTFKARQQPLVELAAASGRPVTDLGVQLDYAWYEMSAGPFKNTLPALKGTTTVSQAATVFHDEFERSADKVLTARINNSAAVLELYGGTTSTSPTTNPTGSTTTCGGGVAISGDFAFPLRTTKANLDFCMDAAWSENCHHDYKAADLFVAPGTGVIAAVSGTVVSASDESCSGSNDFDVPRIQIKGSDGNFYYYTHMKPGSIKVKAGDTVTAGTSDLGVVGPTECAQNTTPHLHFQISSVQINSTNDITEREKYIDPQPKLLETYEKLPEN